MKYFVNGNTEAEKLLEAVQLSQTKFCGVSAMLSKAFPVECQVILIGEEVGVGIANFETNKKESLRKQTREKLIAFYESCSDWAC